MNSTCIGGLYVGQNNETVNIWEENSVFMIIFDHQHGCRADNHNLVTRVFLIDHIPHNMVQYLYWCSSDAILCKLQDRESLLQQLQLLQTDEKLTVST